MPVVRSLLVTKDGCPISARFWQMWDSTAVDSPLLDSQRIPRPIALDTVNSQRSRSVNSHICQNRADMGHPSFVTRRERQVCEKSGLVIYPYPTQDWRLSVNLTGLCLPSVSFMLVAMKSVASSGVEFENWEILSAFLPEGWSEQARQLGAMQRARYIKEPSVVLRILLMHVALGCSLAETAARAQVSGLAQISSVGVFKRLRAAGPWFGWLARQMRGSAELPETITGRRLRAVDATLVHEPGSTGTDWKIHYAVNLADLECDFFQLTEIGQGGETFRRVPVVAGDIVMGDRVYASPASCCMLSTQAAT